MDTKTKVLIVIGSIVVLSITGVIIYVATEPPASAPVTTTTISQTGSATTSSNGALGSIVKGFASII